LEGLHMGVVDWDAQAESVVAKLSRAPGSGTKPEGSRLPTRIRAVDVQSLSKMQFKAREPLLMPWLHSQDLCMVFAPRGVGKTHFCIAIAYAVSTGGTFLGWLAPKPRKVLYLDGELPGAVMQRRCLMHCPESEPHPGMLKLFTPDLPEMDGRALPDLSTYEGQAEIDDLIEPDTGLVIVDNLSAWARSGRENEAESWHPIADWILSLRRRGIAVVLVHHAGKGGQQRGTSKKEDLLDVVISLSRPTDYSADKGAVFIADFTKARNLTGDDAQSVELELTGDEIRASWTWRSAETATYDRVIALHKEGLKPNDIASELEVNKSTVSRHLRRAREMGDITDPPTRFRG
jgi:hypothetical protein